VRTQLLRRIGVLALALFTGSGSGCAHTNNTERGATAGGLVGSAAGAMVGAASGRPLAGAAAGALIGTAGGALVGNAADKEEKRASDIAHAQAVAEARSQQQRMGIADVIGLAQGGHNDQVIINQIRNTRSSFDLTASDLDMLKNAGVSPRVIAEMQASRPALAPARVVVRETAPVVYESPPAVVVRPAPVVYVGPGYHPRPCYGPGVYYGRRW